MKSQFRFFPPGNSELTVYLTILTFLLTIQGQKSQTILMDSMFHRKNKKTASNTFFLLQI